MTSGCAIGAFLVALLVLRSLRRSIAGATELEAAEAAGQSIISDLVPAMVTPDRELLAR